MTMKPTLDDSIPQTLLENRYACVLLWPDKLFVQAWDQYDNAWEYSLRFALNPADAKPFATSHIYLHRGIRHIKEVSSTVANDFLTEFVKLTTDPRRSLFNEEVVEANRLITPRNAGFMKLAFALLIGESAPSVKLLQ